MALSYSREMLAGALLSRGLDAEGDAEALHARLGAALVKELLTPKRGSKRRVDGTSSAPKRSKSEWHSFMKSERPRVVASGVTGRAAIIKEIARRWALWKPVGTSSQPLAIMPPTSDSESDGSGAPLEGLLDALKELDEGEINAALSAHGLSVDGDATAKIHTLAVAMVA